MTMRLLLLCASLMLAAAPAAARQEPDVWVQESSKGTYIVSARFTVNVAPERAYAVLTDYASLPGIIPNIKQSRVVERSEGRVVVEQEAVSRFTFFSKRVRLLLHINESAGRIRFRDARGDSFEVYEGSWTLVPCGDGVTLQYELVARPSFDAPMMVVRKVMGGDAREMVARLSAAMLAAPTTTR